MGERPSYLSWIILSVLHTCMAFGSGGGPLLPSSIGGGGGTVTSVGLSVSGVPELTVSGSPVTTAGTLGLGKANQLANTVWAGPVSGGAGASGFRYLTKSDLPCGLTETAVNYTTVNADCIVGVTDTIMPKAITLVSAVTFGAGNTLFIKDLSGTAGSNFITVSATGGQKIDGSTSRTIRINYGVLRLFSDGANWFSL